MQSNACFLNFPPPRTAQNQTSLNRWEFYYIHIYTWYGHYVPDCSRTRPESWCTRETMHFHIRAIYANYCMKLKSFRGKRWCLYDNVWRGGCVHDDTGGLVYWLFTVGANNFCKSISFRPRNIKRPRKRVYI